MPNRKISKYFIQDGGGAGDVIVHYLIGDRGWGYLKQLKKDEPDSVVRVILSSCNPQSRIFIELCPYIDEIIETPWYNPNKIWIPNGNIIRGYNSLAKVGKERYGKNIDLLDVGLSFGEKYFVDALLSQGPYILIHPFAGMANRMPLDMDIYYELVDILIDELNYNVIVVGGSYDKSDSVEEKGSIKIEEFNYQRPCLYNLVGKSNMRVCTVLAQQSIGFIGTWSCYIYPAMMDGKTKTIVLWPESNIPNSIYYFPKEFNIVVNKPKLPYIRNTVRTFFKQEVNNV